MKTNTKLLFIFAVLLALDQLAKNSFFISICNRNLAWNIPVPAGIFYFVWTIIIVYLLYIFFKTKSYTQKIFLTLILSGAVSNLIDRIRLGCVIDYIDLKFWPASIATRSVAGWPIFNLADVYISSGIILLIINIMKDKSREATQ